MKTTSVRSVLCFAGLIFLLSGCGQEKPAAPVAPPAAPVEKTTPVEKFASAPADPAPPAQAPPAVVKPAPPVKAALAPAVATLGRASLLKEEALLAKPFTDAQVLERLPVGREVDLLLREGAWYQVRVGERQGWVPMASLRRAGQPAPASGEEAAQVATGRSGTGQIISTTGVRGITDDSPKEAPLNDAAVKAAERLVDDAAASNRLTGEAAQLLQKLRPLPADQAGAKKEGMP